MDREGAFGISTRIRTGVNEGRGKRPNSFEVQFRAFGLFEPSELLDLRQSMY